MNIWLGIIRWGASCNNDVQQVLQYRRKLLQISIHYHEFIAIWFWRPVVLGQPARPPHTKARVVSSFKHTHRRWVVKWSEVEVGVN